MKKIITLAIILVLCLVAPSVAGDKEKEPEYELTVKITFNSIPLFDATTLSEKFLKLSKDACEAKVVITAVRDTTMWIRFDDGTN